MQSPMEECLFYMGWAGKIIYILLYTDDLILTGPDQCEIDYILQRMKEVSLKITHDNGASQQFSRRQCVTETRRNHTPHTATPH